MLSNGLSLWYHATQGAADGRAVVLDFVGLGMNNFILALSLTNHPVSLCAVQTTAPGSRFFHHFSPVGAHDDRVRNISSWTWQRT